MPPSRRRTGSFGGSLLATPKPLPEDEPTVDAKAAETAVEPALEERPPAAVPVTPAPPATAPAIAVVPDPEPEPSVDNEQSTATSRGSGKKPPSTIRLDDKAGHPLFDAFLEAKQADPFLSYRQFASAVVLDGLAAHRRRQNRS